MPSTFSPSLRIELIAPGEQAGTWGNTTNTNLGALFDSAIAGAASVSVISANQALTVADGAADQARTAVLQLTTTTGAPFNVYAPPVSKQYTVYNAAAHAATIFNSTVTGNTTAAGTGVTVPAGRTMTVWTNGTNFRVQNDHVLGNLVGNVTGNVTGSVIGNASTATTLQNARTINGVSFNGSANITVTANTTNTLTRGTYLTGNNFNGSAATTWAVDATAVNTPDKVVARDSSGNFSAATITAALNGNATTVTNGVYTTGNQTINGNKTFSGTVGIGANWTAFQSGSDLVFAYNGTRRLKIDLDGNMTVSGDVTAFGTV